MDKALYLTFDDGPNEPYTSQILDILKTFGARATFFVCGENIERHPQSLKNIYDAGHAIGNHSFSHNIKHVLLAGQILKDEIMRTNRHIKMYTGVDNHLYRSPWGLCMPWLKPWLKQNGFFTYHWNIMAFDWSQPPANFIADHIIKRAFPGAIVLLHDGHENIGTDRRQTVKALSAVLGELAGQGYSFHSLDNNIFHPHKIIKDFAADLYLSLKYYI